MADGDQTRLGLNRRESHTFHHTGPGRINEQHGAPSFKVERVLYLQLKVGQQLHIPSGLRADGRQLFQQQRAERIIPPARVADRQHQQWRSHHGA